MQYEDRIVCFIDILGFKNHITQSNADSSKIETISSALMAVRRVLDIDSNLEERDGATITQFSDSIVISFKCNEKSGVFFTLLKLVWTQATLVNHGMLVRGAIVRGNLLHNHDIMFGQGIIDAYEAETKAAIYPRIILARDVLHIALNNAEHHPVEEAEYLSDIIIEDFDGTYYVDYLGVGVQNEFNDPELGYIQYLTKIRNLINDNISSNSVGLRAKYGWLLSKHNTNIDRIEDWLEESGIEAKTMKARNR